MIRRTIIVVLTLAAVCTALLWVGSFQRRCDLVGPTDVGELRLIYVRVERGSLRFTQLSCVDASRRPARLNWHRAGFGLQRLSDPMKRPATLVQFGLSPLNRSRHNFDWSWPPARWVRRVYVVAVIPLWAPFVAFVAYPAVSFVRGPLRRYLRRRKGVCVRCAYDLTGNLSGVCPECGSPIGR